jgi:hypothetical protein
MKTNDVKNPLSGFVALAQIVNIFNCNPQGTALQMKKKPIKMIENNPSFTLYKITVFLQEVDLKMANINMKDPDKKKPLRRRCYRPSAARCAKCAETRRTASTPLR